MLNEKERKRYNRHIILPELGSEGQEKLKAAKVLVVGAGGLGCPVLQYLTAAGVGSIGVIDDDVVEYSNLQRQILYNESMLDKSKAIEVCNVLKKQNPFVNFDAFNYRLTNQNALELFSGYDIIVDGTDNFSTRYLINDACAILNKTLVFGSMFKFEGQVSVFHLTEQSPTYRCLFPEPPSEDSVPNCSEIGVIGVLPGIIGSLQAAEVIKLITGIGEPLDGKLICYNNLTHQFLNIKVQKDIKTVGKYALTEKEFKDKDYDVKCAVNKIGKLKSISLSDLLEHKNEYRIIDIREKYERPLLDIKHTERIPLSELNGGLIEVNNERKTVVCCQSGMRSQRFIDMLLDNNPNLTKIFNLEDGLRGYKK